MTRTKRIWQRKPHPERIHFYYDEMKIYASDKRKIWCVNKRWVIRNRWFRTLRHRDKALYRKIGLRCRSNESIDIDYLDEYFGTRHKKADYTEFFD